MKVTDKQYYMDGYLKDNLDILKKAVSKNWDGVIMIDGIEGSAKTTIGGSIAYYLDPKFNLDKVVFTQNQFFELVDRAEPGSAILWDEFIFGGLSTEALNKVQNNLIKKMTTIRKKRLFIILVMPWFFMMRPYFAIGRSRCLIHTYSPDGISRGRFKFYSYRKKQLLYQWGKKEYRYTTKPDFFGMFTDTFGMFWDSKEYDNKKEEAIISLTKEEQKIDKVDEKVRPHLYKIIVYLRDTMKMTWPQIMDIAKANRSKIRYWYQQAGINP